MDDWLGELRHDLDALRAGSLLRELTMIEPQGPMLRRQGRDLVNLASNDYLGLSTHPRLRDAAEAAIRRWGVGAGASRLVVGHLPPHRNLEQRFAAFKHAEAALLYPTGFTANLGVLTALAQPGDVICADKLNHASLLDAARYSGATLRVFPHLGYDKLRRLLERHALDRKRGPVTGDALAAAVSPLPPRAPRVFIVTDSIFSMDGDAADLPLLCDLADAFDAILVIDEAHGTGVLGEHGQGLCELQGVAQRVDIVVSTASKALGGLGGIVTARQEVIDTLVNRARPFIYTTAVPPAQAAAIDAALDVIHDEPWRRQRVLALAQRVHDALPSLGLPTLRPRGLVTPIIPLLVGEPVDALALSAHLAHAGLFAPAIRPPTVAPGTSRVRLSLRADLDDAMVDRLLAALGDWRASPTR